MTFISYQLHPTKRTVAIDSQWVKIREASQQWGFSLKIDCWRDNISGYPILQWPGWQTHQLNLGVMSACANVRTALDQLQSCWVGHSVCFFFNSFSGFRRSGGFRMEIPIEVDDLDWFGVPPFSEPPEWFGNSFLFKGFSATICWLHIGWITGLGWGPATSDVCAETPGSGVCAVKGENTCDVAVPDRRGTWSVWSYALE